MINDLVVGDAGADRVRQADVSVAIRVDQTRHAEARVFPEDLRIKEVVIDSAINDIDRLQTLRRAHENLAVMCDQIAAFDDFDSHRAREKRMLEVGRIVNSRCEQHDGRLASPFGAM